MATFLQDLRYALRMLAKSPGFTAVAILTLALGIGANTAIFSVINGLFLHPPGIPHPDRLVTLRVKYEKLGMMNIVASAPDFAQVRDSKEVFDTAAIVTQADFNYLADDGPQRLLGAEVTWQWFDVFGAKPLLGRTFVPEDDQPKANHEAVLAYGSWKRWFGGDTGVVGRTVQFNEQPYKIIGVMPAEFRWPNETDLWVPLGLAPEEFAPDNRYNENYFAVARIRPEVTFARAQAFVGLLAERDIQHDPSGKYAQNSGWGMFVVPLGDFVFGQIRTPLRILLGAVALVLLIACANIAGLLLARATGRAKEFAIRSAMGAQRWALIRQALTESLLLAGAGAAVGLALAKFGISALFALAPENLAAGVAIPIDGFVVLFTGLIGILAALVFGIIPAWHASKLDPSDALKESGSAVTSGRARLGLRSVLVVGELALALVLLAGAGLLLKSLSHLGQVNPGFRPQGVMTAALALPESKYDKPEKQFVFFQTVLEHLANSPGVTAAGAGYPLPFSGGGSTASFGIEDRPAALGDPGPHGAIRFVSPGYFSTLGIPLLKGRYFTDQDRKGTQAVAVIDENLAQQYWPNQDPIGKRLRHNSSDPWSTIIGVVGHIRFSQLAGEEQSSDGAQSSAKGSYYFPIYQTEAPFGFLIARTPGDAASLASIIREAVHTADANQPVHDLKTMNARIWSSLGPQRFAVTLLGVFAAMALLLAALGLYGLISFMVAQRTHEIGIRIALGATQADVLRLVAIQGMGMVATGLAIGVAAAVAVSFLMRSLLYGVQPSDPVTYLGVAVMLGVVALLACYLPARRATRVDPLVALRYE
jgi:predicted permease